jgi:deoxyribodipyrimidine photo-lyase
MYISMLHSNIFKAAWLPGAKWMYANLLDHDPAANFLSWQWVAGTFSSKQYIANQENINKYTGSTQQGTFLDTSYEKLPNLKVACAWAAPEYTFCPKPTLENSLDAELPTFLYTPYHLDPNWRAEEAANKLLFWDLDSWNDYPFTENVFHWINALAKVQIPDIQIVVGSWGNFKTTLQAERTFTKEHPLLASFDVQQDPRTWLCPQATEKPGSFFNYWKKVQKHLRNEN